MRKFYNPEEYRRFVFGKNFKDGYAEKILEEFSELAIDNPKLTEINKFENWTVIPVPSEASNGDFMNLVRWFTQNGETSYGIAVHKVNSYFVIPDTMNKWGDTVLIGFDNGMSGRWEIPIGFSDEAAAFTPMNEENFKYFEGSDYIEEDYTNCKNFLKCKNAELLLDVFK